MDEGGCDNMICAYQAAAFAVYATHGQMLTVFVQMYLN